MLDATNLEREIKNERRAELRRHRYSTDPIWRLTKLKDNWERRERKRRENGA